MALGKNIETIMLKKGLNIAKLSNKAGVPYGALYSLIKRNSNSTKTAYIAKIAFALEVEPEILLGYEESEDGVLHKSFKSEKECIEDEYLIREIRSTADLSNRLTTAFDSMNETGQKKAVENVEDLAKIPEYKKTPTTGRIKKS